MYEFRTAVQACVWFASQDDEAVSSLPDNFTFAMLGFHVERELIDSDDDAHAVVIDEGMSFGQLRGLLDIIAEYCGPRKADRPGTAWIESAQRELLAACGHGVLKMTGRPLCGGASREIPAEAFATFRFFEYDGVDCLGPPDLTDANCWRDLRLQANEVRRVWPKDSAVDTASSPSTPAVVQPSPTEDDQPKKVEPSTATPPTYAAGGRYLPDEVPNEFREWAQAQHNAGVIITAGNALTAMQQRLVPGVGLSRDTVREWVKTLPLGWAARRGTSPSR